ncbi:MAG: hypothetical protein SGI91_24300 [Alphaproteobacteria bacterium]|nr:hypothetical protein [Alphaproteobacteria bacterium]
MISKLAAQLCFTVTLTRDHPPTQNASAGSQLNMGRRSFSEGGWVAGSSPAMTDKGVFVLSKLAAAGVGERTSVEIPA